MRTVVFVLLAVLLVSVLPPSGAVSAQEAAFRNQFFSDTTPAQALYFDVAGTAGIIRGDSGLGGRVRPSQPVTRAEFAVMVMRLLALDPAFTRPETSGRNFGDADAIPTWAAEDVSACVALGIIAGVPDGAGGFDFRPGETVGGAEAVAMLLRALGNANNITAGWPLGFLYRAFETGLFSRDVAADDWRFIQPLTPLTRAQTAYLVHNALFCFRDYKPPATAGEGTYGRSSIGGALTGYSLVLAADLLMRTVTTSDGRVLRLAATVVAPGIKGAGDLIGSRVFCFRDDRGRIALMRRYAQEPPVTGTLDRLRIREDKSRVEAVVLTTGTVVPCAPGAIVELNNQRWPFDPGTILPSAEVTALTDQGQAIYVSIIQENLPEAVIKSLALEPSSYAGGPTTGMITARISLGEGDIPLVITADTQIYLNGKPADLSDLREWDVFYAAAEGTSPKRVIRLYAYRNQVTGTVVDMVRHYSSTGFSWEAIIEDYRYQRTGLNFTTLCEALLSLDLTGLELTFCLDRHGKVSYFAPPGPTPQASRVVKVVRSVSVRGSTLLTVDWRGGQLTYTLAPGAPAPETGSLVRLAVDSDGRTRDISPAKPAFFDAIVSGVDVPGQRLTLTRDRTTWSLSVRFVPIYLVAPGKDHTAVGPHLPLAGLAEGDIVRLDDPGAPGYILVLALPGR